MCLLILSVNDTGDILSSVVCLVHFLCYELEKYIVMCMPGDEDDKAFFIHKQFILENMISIFCVNFGKIVE